jgi:biopolymer transport protein ExbD
MARKRKKQEIHAGELNLTAMIDVAFQLLSFFIITVHPVDVITHLNVFRPAPDAAPTTNAQPAKMIRITIYREGYTINDKAVDVRQLEALLFKLADLDKKQTILIMCNVQSLHSELVEVLDLCAKAGLVNLSVVSSV